jgi:high-affinity nickel permease
VKQLKQILVSFVIAAGLMGMIAFLDLVMGTEPRKLLWKAINPFKVMEAAEYIIIVFFSVSIMIKALRYYIKKKKSNQPSNNG